MSYSSFSQNYKSPLTLLGEGVGNLKNSSTGMFGRFRNNRYISGSSEFLNSNTLIAKVSFLLLVIIGFVLVLNLSSKLIAMMMIPNKNPILIDGMHDGEIALHISQNPNVKVSFATHHRAREWVKSTGANFLSLGRFPISPSELRATLKKISADPSMFRGLLTLFNDVYLPLFQPMYNEVLNIIAR